MSDIAIEVHDVWKRFHRGQLHDNLRDLVPFIAKRLVGRRQQSAQLAAGDFWALQSISFQVKRGEALGIIGPNGAGKSTMLKILSRILRPNQGYMHISGRLSALIEVAAGFHSDLTGRENIYLNGAVLGIKKRDIDSKIKEIIEFSGIEPFLDTPVKRYSSGMMARLGFSVMAHMNPEVLLIDEVLSVGDMAFRTKCINHMTKLLRSDVSVVFISHNLDQVRQLCDRCLVLDQGTMQFIGEVDDACKQYIECLRSQNKSTTSIADTANADFLSSAGCLLGLTILDEQGVPSFKIPSSSPVTLEVSYSLNYDLEHVGLVVNFERADGSHITRLSTMYDNIKLPSHAGRQTVSIFMDGFPFYGGEYLISMRLFDISNGKTIDFHNHRYPFMIIGPENTDQTFYLQHKWSCDTNS